jgi:hypothetical protein
LLRHLAAVKRLLRKWQMPASLYREAKRIAAQQELSSAEVVRRG